MSYPPYGGGYPPQQGYPAPGGYGGWPGYPQATPGGYPAPGGAGIPARAACYGTPAGLFYAPQPAFGPTYSGAYPYAAFPGYIQMATLR